MQCLYLQFALVSNDSKKKTILIAILHTTLKKETMLHCTCTCISTNSIVCLCVCVYVFVCPNIDIELWFLCPTELMTTILRVDTKLLTVFIYVHDGCYFRASSIPSKLKCKCIYIAIISCLNFVFLFA